MPINVDLLDQTLAHIEAHPEQWSQRGWRRTSTMCFASHAAALAGGIWAHPARDAEVSSSYLVADPGDPAQDVDAFGTIHTRCRATRLLGLSEGQARKLFYAVDDLDVLRRIVAELKAEYSIEQAEAVSRG